MGRLDLMIELEHGPQCQDDRPKKEERKRPTRGSPSRIHDDHNESQSSDEDVTNIQKDYNLYLAAKYDNLDGFLTVLDRVSAAEHASYADILIRLSPSLVLRKNSDGDTPLHLAAKAGQESVVRSLLLIRRQAENLEEVRYLLDKCAPSATQRDNSGSFPIHLASINGSVEIISLLLQDCPCPEELLDRNDLNILHLAMPVLKNPGLLEEEEEESYGTSENMDPELYRATTEGDILHFVRAMEKGQPDRYHSPPASCVQLGPQKNTVLHIATSFAHYEIVKLICKDLPFFVAEKNAKGDTALHIAARAGDSLLVMLLVNSDFKEGGLAEKNDEGNTALHEALKYGHEEVARILINKNLEMPYSLNKEGKSLLYLAAEAGFVTIVRLLMDNPK